MYVQFKVLLERKGVGKYSKEVSDLYDKLCRATERYTAQALSWSAYEERTAYVNKLKEDCESIKTAVSADRREFPS